MDLDSTKVLEHLSAKYPEYRPIKVNDFRRKETGAWVKKINHHELYNYGPIDAQLKAIIQTGAVQVSILLRKKIDDSILIPDIDLKQLTNFN